MDPHWTENTLTLGGSPFHYWRTGGGRPPLVLCHGFTDNGLCWLPVARRLQDRFDVILPDARGHGLSARVQPGEPIDRAADLAGLIEALKLERPVVGGHSMGASTTADLGVRFPGLARALVLEDPVWRDPAPEEQPARAAARFNWLAELAGRSLDEMIASCRAQNPAWGEDELRPWAESKQQFDPGLLQTLVPMGEWRPAALALRCPTLLFHSEVGRGGIVSPQVAQEAAALNPLIRPAHIPGAGHNIRRENFPAYMQALEGFLGEVHREAT